MSHFLTKLTAQSRDGKLVSKRNLVQDILLCVGRQTEHESALLAQVRLAQSRSRTDWLQDVAKQALDLAFQEPDWISTHIYKVHVRKNRPSAPFTGPCKDIRLVGNPDLPRSITNAATGLSETLTEPEDCLDLLADYDILDEVLGSPPRPEEVEKIEVTSRQPESMELDTCDVIPMLHRFSPVRYPPKKDVEWTRKEFGSKEHRGHSSSSSKARCSNRTSNHRARTPLEKRSRPAAFSVRRRFRPTVATSITCKQTSVKTPSQTPSKTPLETPSSTPFQMPPFETPSMRAPLPMLFSDETLNITPSKTISVTPTKKPFEMPSMYVPLPLLYIEKTPFSTPAKTHAVTIPSKPVKIYPTDILLQTSVKTPSQTPSRLRQTSTLRTPSSTPSRLPVRIVSTAFPQHRRPVLTETKRQEERKLDQRNALFKQTHRPVQTSATPIASRTAGPTASHTDILTASPTVRRADKRRVEDDRGSLTVHSNPCLPPLSTRQKRRRMMQEKVTNMPCLVDGCVFPFSHLKLHVLKGHLPEIFDDALPLDVDLTRRRLSALKLISGWMLGGCSTLQHLATYIDSTELLSSDLNLTMSPIIVEAVGALCAEGSMIIPKTYTLCPLSTPAMLFHWRAMYILIARLEPRHRASLCTQFAIQQRSLTSIENTTPKENIALPVNVQPSRRENLPEAFESHFHLDRTRIAAKQRNASFTEICQSVQPTRKFRVTVIGATANFCDPQTYPTLKEVASLHGQGVKVTIGIHPKKTAQFTSAAENQVNHLLRSPNICGVGEIGLDFSAKAETWGKQCEVFDRMLKKVQRQHVVVIHCRGSQGTGDVIYHSAFIQMKITLPRDQHIHLHCFSGSSSVVQTWSDAFPNCYFGYTQLAGSLGILGLSGLRRVPPSRLLLETDAPYFTFAQSVRENCSQPYSAPSLLGMVADVVASKLDSSWEDVLRTATANAQRIYH